MSGMSLGVIIINPFYREQLSEYNSGVHCSLSDGKVS